MASLNYNDSFKSIGKKNEAEFICKCIDEININFRFNDLQTMLFDCINF